LATNTLFTPAPLLKSNILDQELNESHLAQKLNDVAPPNVKVGKDIYPDEPSKV